MQDLSEPDLADRGLFPETSKLSFKHDGEIKVALKAYITEGSSEQHMKIKSITYFYLTEKYNMI
jgi:hypothetical protein